MSFASILLKIRKVSMGFRNCIIITGFMDQKSAYACLMHSSHPPCFIIVEFGALYVQQQLFTRCVNPDPATALLIRTWVSFYKQNLSINFPHDQQSCCYSDKTKIFPADLCIHIPLIRPIHMVQALAYMHIYILISEGFSLRLQFRLPSGPGSNWGLRTHQVLNY